MADLNDLLEEGITRSQELTDAVDEALAAIDEELRDADDVGGALVDLTEGIRTAREEVALRTTAARGTLAAAQRARSASLDAALSAVRDRQDAAATALAEGAADVAHLAELRTRLADDQEAHVLETAAGAAALQARALAVTGAASTRLAAAADAVTSLRAVLESARATFAEQMEEWEAAAEELADGARRQSASWVEELQGLLAGHTAVLRDLAGAVSDRHDAALQSVGHEIGEAAPLAMRTGVVRFEEQARDAHDQSERAEEISADCAESVTRAAADLMRSCASLRAGLGELAETT